ncbi:MAG: hypothetical protein KAH01_05295 [Caldisericia bacterium]|nr:hypothetical protein [Caldisericia bacterium]
MNEEKRRKKGSLSIELLVVMFMSICLIVPLGMWMQQNSQRFIKSAQEDAIKLDIQFLLADIETSWMNFQYDYWKTQPFIGLTESKLSFETDDNKFIRYYRKGDQIGKDVNYSKFENITLRVVSDFRVTQSQRENKVIMRIFVKDSLGRRYVKMLSGDK